jgi:hypothetical protein
LVLGAMVNLAKSGAAHLRKIGGGHLRALPAHASHPEYTIPVDRQSDATRGAH